MPVTSWSTTAADNDDSDIASGITLAEGQAPGSVNDSIRSLMAVIKGDFAHSLSTQGYQKFPNGLILQWGLITTTLDSGGNGSVPWPLAFPTSALWGMVCNSDPGTYGDRGFSIITVTTAAFSFGVRASPGAVPVSIRYAGIGY